MTILPLPFSIPFSKPISFQEVIETNSYFHILEKSNSNARNSVKAGAVYINEQKIEDFNFDVESSFLENNVLLIRKGKKNFRIVVK